MASSARRRRSTGPASAARRGRPTRIRPGTLPGTLAGKAPETPPRITLMAFTRETLEEREFSTVDETLSAIPATGVTWINVDGLLAPAELARLGARYNLHALALEDVLNIPQRPKVERYDAYYFVVMRTIRTDRDPTHFVFQDEQVSLFFGKDWVITLQERADGDCFGAVRDAIRQRRGRVRDAGADYLAYLLLDSVIDAYFPVIETMSERMQSLEARAIEETSQDILLDIQDLRHQLLTLRRAVWPMREEILILQRDESPLLAPETRMFLRDVYDHAVQALEIVESLRETVVSVMEIHLSVQNQKLNEVMKVLTVIATLFIPLTTIASIYGMNFQHMPELHWRYGYAWALGLMAITAGAMLAYFRRQGWW